jgi:hypothetical protein
MASVRASERVSVLMWVLASERAWARELARALARE